MLWFQKMYKGRTTGCVIQCNHVFKRVRGGLREQYISIDQFEGLREKDICRATISFESGKKYESTLDVQISRY